MSKSIARNSFILHLDSLVILDEMTNEQAGIFLKSIKQYQITKKLPELDFGLKMAITPFINQFIRDDEKYLNIVERNKINISKRWSKNTTGTTGIPKVTKNTDSDSKSDSDSESDSKNKLSVEGQFESFWNLYDKKKSRPDAEKKFKAALKKDTFENIIAGLEKYIKARGTDAQYWKHPSTWLHQECWKDELETTQKNQQEATKFKPLVDFINKISKDTLVDKITLPASNKPIFHFKRKADYDKLTKLADSDKQLIKSEIFKTFGRNDFDLNY